MIIKVKGIIKRYNKFTAVDNIDLEVKEGEILGLLGPNGAGKSTTINSILGLTKVDEGVIEVFGNDVSKNARKFKKDIGYVPQDIAVFDELNAYDNVMFFGKLYGLRGSELKKGVMEALNFTGLWDRRKDYPKKYSGGMKRRLNIACAIVHKPKLLIMDEPTVGVDPQSRNNILESIKTLNKMGTTVIYTSHYMEEIEEICDRIAIIDSGKLIVDGTSESIKASILTEEIVSIEVDSESERFEKILETINGVISCVCKENMIVIKSKKDSNNLSKLLDEISRNGSKIISVNIEKPTLEAAFLVLTGRKLRD